AVYIQSTDDQLGKQRIISRGRSSILKPMIEHNSRRKERPPGGATAVISTRVGRIGDPGPVGRSYRTHANAGRRRRRDQGVGGIAMRIDPPRDRLRVEREVEARGLGRRFENTSNNEQQ